MSVLVCSGKKCKNVVFFFERAINQTIYVLEILQIYIGMMPKKKLKHY